MSQIRIAVVGNCQVTGLGRCLEALSPNVQVVTSAVMPAGGGLLPREMHALAEADVVLVCNADRPEFQEQSFLDATSGAELIEVPVLAFRAFHPDTALVLADGVPVGNPWVSTWNSLALSWAYAQGWSVEQALTLFSDEVFENLGYLDYWDVSANALEFQFARLGFDFGTWIQAVQRTGVFMHGMNHPGLVAQGALAVQVLQRLGHHQSMSLAALPRYVEDPLWHAVWPVHASIADRLAVVGSEMVRGIRGLIGFPEFAALCFETWRSAIPDSAVFTFPNNQPEAQRLSALMGVRDEASV